MEALRAAGGPRRGVLPRLLRGRRPLLRRAPRGLPRGLRARAPRSCTSRAPRRARTSTTPSATKHYQVVNRATLRAQVVADAARAARARRRPALRRAAWRGARTCWSPTTACRRRCATAARGGWPRSSTSCAALGCAVTVLPVVGGREEDVAAPARPRRRGAAAGGRRAGARRARPAPRPGDPEPPARGGPLRLHDPARRAGRAARLRHRRPAPPARGAPGRGGGRGDRRRGRRPARARARHGAHLRRHDRRHRGGAELCSPSTSRTRRSRCSARSRIAPSASRRSPARAGIVFVGSYLHPPNADAARFFARRRDATRLGGAPGRRAPARRRRAWR